MADDSPLFREGLGKLLARTPDLELVGSPADMPLVSDIRGPTLHATRAVPVLKDEGGD